MDYAGRQRRRRRFHDCQSGKKRIVTAVALVVFTAAVIFLGGWVTIAAAYLAMILVTMDAVRAIKKAGIRPMGAD